MNRRFGRVLFYKLAGLFVAAVLLGSAATNAHARLREVEATVIWHITSHSPLPADTFNTCCYRTFEEALSVFVAALATSDLYFFEYYEELPAGPVYTTPEAPSYRAHTVINGRHAYNIWYGWYSESGETYYTQRTPVIPVALCPAEGRGGPGWVWIPADSWNQYAWCLVDEPDEPDISEEGGRCAANGLSNRPMPANAVGNPILVDAGIKWQQEIDYESPSPTGLQFLRTYRSDLKGWQSSIEPYGFNFSLNNPEAAPRPACYLGTAQWGSGFSFPHCFPYRRTTAAVNFELTRDNGRLIQFQATTAGSTKATDAHEVLEPAPSGSSGWHVRRTDNATEHYDDAGRLLSTTFVNGHRLSYTYAATGGRYPVNAPICAATSWAVPMGSLQCVTDHFGRQLRLGYDSMGRMTHLMTPAAAVYEYEFNGPSALGFPAGSLVDLITRVTYPDSHSKTYHYNEPTKTGGANAPLWLTGVTDESGTRLANFEYSAGQSVATERAGGAQRYTVDYVASNHRVVTDALGNSTEYWFSLLNPGPKLRYKTQPAGAGCNAATLSNVYESNGDRISTTNFNGTQTQFTYDPVRKLETLRSVGTWGSVDKYISTQWHPDWRLKTKQAEPLRLTTWVYNGQPDPFNGGVALSCVPPGTALLPNGKPIAVLCKQVEQATGDSTGSQGFGATPTGTPRVLTYTYNSDGQVLTEDGPRTDVADVTTYEYYSATDTTQTPPRYYRGDLKQITNAAGQITQFAAYHPDGRPSRIIDANGMQTTLSYHPRGWLTGVTVDDGSAVRTTSYEYWPTGKLKKVTQPDGSYVSYSYDAAQWLIAVSDSAGNRIDYTLDAMGNRIGEAVKDPNQTLAHSVQRSFDALNRVQQLTGAQP